LPQRAGSAITRVHVRAAARSFDPRIERVEIRAPHVDLATHFDFGGEPPARRLAQAQRNIAHGPQVEGDVLTEDPVSARGAALEGAVPVGQRYGKAIDLGLCLVLEPGVGQDARQARVPGCQFFPVIHIAQREEGDGVLNPREAFVWRCADALGG
jgi:hypothetical protein